MAPPRRRPFYPYIKLFSLPLHTLAPAHSVLVAAHGSILHRGKPELRGQGTVDISRAFRMVPVICTVSRFLVPVRGKQPGEVRMHFCSRIKNSGFSAMQSPKMANLKTL